MTRHPRRKQSLLRVFEDQSGRCSYCGVNMTLSLGQPNTATRDHVVPRSAGGPTEAWNIVAACSCCNSRKGDKPLVEWLCIITGGRPYAHPMAGRIRHDLRSRVG